ncbi:hypothetical protein [Sphingomonas sp. LaA6.9]|uniref:hypothetical protein n=1 Tax=Sphingomonas sp. LaA6.9 TaxID=2919914 RepID=UPI001F4F3A25|nr:hypothetical protein [Sphingomonas sp. LaA6.9]MCJ8157098.1 hypothetical protein [Sphingomonas sp. LaA6.9]
MNQWIPATDFIAADVVRWTEGIYDRRRRGKALRVGERLVAAEVIERGKDGWVKLLVRACTITKDEFAGKSILPLKAGEQVRRGEKTILRGKPQRLQWDDETARQAVVNGSSRGSRYIKKDDDEE